MDSWVGSYLRDARKRRAVNLAEPIHVLLCIADHYEPSWGKPTAEVARQRVEQWLSDYPRLFGRLRDSDGRPPQHTFFFPLDEYVAEHVDGIAQLCRAGFGEVEFHLHHDNDTAENLRQTLATFKDLFAQRHGLLARNRHTGEVAYGFIHGNWALDNSRPDGRWCGVNNELDILRQTGCYADFTMPSAPDQTQTRQVNSIYYAVDDPDRPKSHDTGRPVGTAKAPDRALLLIQGPLLFNWRSRKWGVIPRVENACLQRNQPPGLERLDLWLKARIQVPQRPDWFFIKLHTHGCTEDNRSAVLGEPMVRFHEALARRARENPNFHYHYVTAREMYNLVKAAEAGWQGSVAQARDYELLAPGSSLVPLAAASAAS
jgi:hypothetical protein